MTEEIIEEQVETSEEEVAQDEKGEEVTEVVEKVATEEVSAE